MAVWLYANHLLTAIGSGLTRYVATAGADSPPATESQAQILIRGSYTAKNLMANCTAITGTHTLTFRKNAGAGSQTISITTTGQKEDTTNTDSLADGDLIAYQSVTSGGHSDTATLRSISVLLDDAGANIPLLICAQASPSTTPTKYGRVTGETPAGATE